MRSIYVSCDYAEYIPVTSGGKAVRGLLVEGSAFEGSTDNSPLWREHGGKMGLFVDQSPVSPLEEDQIITQEEFNFLLSNKRLPERLFEKGLSYIPVLQAEVKGLGLATHW